MFHYRRILILFITLFLINACSLAIDSFSNNLNRAVMANNDPVTVMQGLPAYLILMDGLVEGDPEDEDLLMASAKLMNAYAGLLATQLALLPEDQSLQIQKIKEQQEKLTVKALQRSTQAICLYEEDYCGLTQLNFQDFAQRLKDFDEDDLDMLYNLGTVWASYLQSHTDDWNAMAKLPQIKHIMQIVINIDEHWQNAGAHMYLGVLNSLLPSSMGGKPELGKQHFEAAIKLTQGKSLMAKVLYAEYYARLTFNQKLHQALINDVLNSQPQNPQFQLMNTLARQKARMLQATAADFF